MVNKHSCNITLSVQGELGKKMENHPDVKWSQVARNAIEAKIREIEFEKQILSKSNLTKKDVAEISSMINRAVFMEMKRK
jgi:hypothetical protein